MMLRTYLFHGKRLDNSEWVEGFYCKHDTVKVCFTTDDPKTKHLIIIDGFCDWGFEPPLQGIEVDPETIGQYTGLVDKTGKKIFEGDIVKWNDKMGYIVFDIGCFSVKYLMPHCLHRNSPAIDIVFHEYPNEIEIIGNIHDNLELLEAKENGPL